MSESMLQPILRCEQCRKPFDKSSTLKRHGYYCRSRRLGMTKRARSCTACARAKVRCDGDGDACSRCTTKSTQCNYVSGRSHDTRSTTHSAAARRSTAKHAPSQDHLGSGNGSYMTDGDAAGTSAHDPTTESQSLTWDHDTDLSSYLLDWQNIDTRQLGLQTSSEEVQSSSRFDERALQVRQPHEIYNVSTLPLPAVPNTHTLRLLRRPVRQPAQERIADLVLHTLCSYPLMILHHKNLPPFIHSSLAPDNDGDDKMYPLNNCLSLMHMISGGIKGSRKLFWENVRSECERLLVEHSALDIWGLLAAMQALSIYILMRLMEGETSYNNHDQLMLTTVIVVVQQFALVELECIADHVLMDNRSKWKHWIFQESMRRMSVIYKIVNLLFYFEPVAICDLHNDLIIAPLPAKKELWEAADESCWNQTRDDTHKSFALAANGELVLLDSEQMFCESTLRYGSSRIASLSLQSLSWGTWCSGMDGLGSLVMLAASLIT